MNDRVIRIRVDSRGARRDADQLNQSMRGVGASSDRAAFSVNKLAAAIAAVISVQKVSQYADAFTRVQNQIIRTTSSSEQLAATTERLLRVSNDTRAGLEVTAELYTSLSVSTQDLGKSQEDIIQVTETINNLFLESGKGADETAGAIRQLGQALQSGALRGDEFNSVAEGAPGILRAIEAQTGKTRAELRELAAQGQITAQLIVESLQNYSEEAQKAADKTEITLQQAFTVAGNNLTFFVGQLDTATGASASLAGSIVNLSEYISSPEFISGLFQAFETASLTIDAASDSVGDFSNELQLVSDSGSNAVSLLGDAFKNLLPNLRGLVQVITVELASGIDKLRVSATALFNILSDPLDTESMRAAMDVYNSEIERINSVREESIQLIFDEREAIISTAAANAQARIAEANARKAERASRGAGESAPTASGFVGLGGGDEDKSNREVNSAKAVTRSLEEELNLRRTVAQIYRDNELAQDASLYEQQLAIVRTREAEQLAIAQSRATEEAAQREERLAATLENDKLTAEARLALKAEFEAQELLAAQILEQEKTAILQDGVNARIELEQAERDARLANAGALGNALINLGQGQSKKIFKIGQKLALAQAAVALPTAVLESFKNGGGYPWGLVPAAAMLATGLKNIQQIKGAGSGLGGGGGGSVPTPSLGGGSGSGQPQIPSTANSQELVQQRRIIDLRGVKADDKITVSAFAALLEEDGAIVTLENARENASRRNVIGVSAR